MCVSYKVNNKKSKFVTLPRRGHAYFGRRSRRTTDQFIYTTHRTAGENVTVRESARIGMIDNRKRLTKLTNEQQLLRRRQVLAQEIHEAREQIVASSDFQRYINSTFLSFHFKKHSSTQLITLYVHMYVHMYFSTFQILFIFTIVTLSFFNFVVELKHLQTNKNINKLVTKAGF